MGNYYCCCLGRTNHTDDEDAAHAKSMAKAHGQPKAKPLVKAPPPLLRIPDDQLDLYDWLIQADQYRRM